MGQHKQRQRKKTRHEIQLSWNAGNWEEKVHPTTERAWSLPGKNQLLPHWENLEGMGGEGGGGGIGMGNTCKPLAVSFQCMTKSTTNKKKKRKKKKKQRTQQVLVAVKVYGSRKESQRRIQRQEEENKK